MYYNRQKVNKNIDIISKVSNNLIKDSEIIFINKSKEIFRDSKDNKIILDNIKSELNKNIDHIDIKSKIFKSAEDIDLNEETINYVLDKVIIPNIITPYFKTIGNTLTNLKIRKKIDLLNIKDEMSSVLKLRAKRYISQLDEKLSNSINLTESISNNKLKWLNKLKMFALYHIINTLVLGVLIKLLVNKLLKVNESIFTLNIKNLIIYKFSELKKVLKLPKLLLNDSLKNNNEKIGIVISIILFVIYSSIELKLFKSLLN